MTVRLVQCRLLTLLLGIVVIAGALRAQQLPDVRLSPTDSTTPPVPLPLQSAARVGSRTLVAFTTTVATSDTSVGTAIAVTLFRDTMSSTPSILVPPRPGITAPLAVFGSRSRFFVAWEEVVAGVRSIMMQTLDSNAASVGAPFLIDTGISMGSAVRRWSINGVDSTKLVVDIGTVGWEARFLLISIGEDGTTAETVETISQPSSFYDGFIMLDRLPGARIHRFTDGSGNFFHADGREDTRTIPTGMLGEGFVVLEDSSVLVAQPGGQQMILLHYPSMFDTLGLERTVVTEKLFPLSTVPLIQKTFLVGVDSAGNRMIVVYGSYQYSEWQGTTTQNVIIKLLVSPAGQIIKRDEPVSTSYHTTSWARNTSSGDYSIGCRMLDHGYSLLSATLRTSSYSSGVGIDPERTTTSSTTTSESLFDRNTELRRGINNGQSEQTVTPGGPSARPTTTTSRWSDTIYYPPLPLTAPGESLHALAGIDSSGMVVIGVKRLADSNRSMVAVALNNLWWHVSLPLTRVMDTVNLSSPAIRHDTLGATILWKGRTNRVGRYSAGGMIPTRPIPGSFVPLPGGACLVNASVSPGTGSYIARVGASILLTDTFRQVYATSWLTQINSIQQPGVSRHPVTGEYTVWICQPTNNLIVVLDSNGRLIKERPNLFRFDTTVTPIVVDTSGILGLLPNSGRLQKGIGITHTAYFADRRAIAARTRFQPLTDTSFLRLFPLNDMANGGRLWRVETYSTSLQLLDTLTLPAPNNDTTCGIVLHMPTGAIGLMWSSDTGIRLTLLHRTLRVMQNNLRVSDASVGAYQPAAIFQGDTLLTLWQNRSTHPWSITASRWIIPDTLRTQLLSTIIIDNPDHSDSTDDNPDQQDSTDDNPSPDKLAAGLHIIPMPVSDRLNITLDSIGAGAVSIELHDMNGALRWSLPLPDQPAGPFTLTIDVAVLPRGVYRLMVTHAGGAASRTIVIDR